MAGYKAGIGKGAALGNVIGDSMSLYGGYLLEMMMGMIDCLTMWECWATYRPLFAT